MHENVKKVYENLRKIVENAENLYFFVLGMAEDTPALLDGVIDSSHRSFLSVVQRVKLNVLRPRPPAEFIPVDPRWVPR